MNAETLKHAYYTENREVSMTFGLHFCFVAFRKEAGKIEA